MSSFDDQQRSEGLAKVTDWKKMIGLALLLAGALPVAACAKQAPGGDTQISASEHRQSSAVNSTNSISKGLGSATGGGLMLRQFEQCREQHIMSADTNHDGKVSRTEFMAARATGKGNLSKRFAHLDRNGDGSIDRQEIDGAATRRFAKLDADGDGRVSKAERKAHRGTVSGDPGRPAGDDAE